MRNVIIHPTRLWFGAIWVWSPNLHNTNFAFLPAAHEGRWSIRGRNPKGFMGHFSMAGTLMYYTLTHHFYCDFCHMKKYWRHKSYGSGLLERPRGWFVKTWVFMQTIIDGVRFTIQGEELQNHLKQTAWFQNLHSSRRLLISWDLKVSHDSMRHDERLYGAKQGWKSFS